MPEHIHTIAGELTSDGHRLRVRVYYEDTDLSGLVYHANYLKFCERGRTDFLRLSGIHHNELQAGETPRSFVVRRMDCEFLMPARIDEVIEVDTRLTRLTGARLELLQTVMRDGQILFHATVTAALIDAAGRPVRFPKPMLAALARLVPHAGGR